jgi:hypothetical protein
VDDGYEVVLRRRQRRAQIVDDLRGLCGIRHGIHHRLSQRRRWVVEFTELRGSTVEDGRGRVQCRRSLHEIGRIDVSGVIVGITADICYMVMRQVRHGLGGCKEEDPRQARRRLSNVSFFSRGSGWVRAVP